MCHEIRAGAMRFAFKTVSHILLAWPGYTRHDARLAKRGHNDKSRRRRRRRCTTSVHEREFSRGQKECSRNNNLQLSRCSGEQPSPLLSTFSRHERKTFSDLSHARQSVITSALALIRPVAKTKLPDSEDVTLNLSIPTILYISAVPPKFRST